MGTSNSIAGSVDDQQFRDAIKQMKKQRNKQSIEYSSINAQYQQRYRNHLIQSLSASQLPKNYKKLLLQTIENKITKKDLTQTVAIINTLKNDHIQQYMSNLSAYEDLYSTLAYSKNISRFNTKYNKNCDNDSDADNESVISVTVKFDKQKFKNRRKLSNNYSNFRKIAKNQIGKSNLNNSNYESTRQISKSKSSNYQLKSSYQSKYSTTSLYSKSEQNCVQGRIKFVKKFLTKQINKPHHPFVTLTKRFAQMLSIYLQKEKPLDSQEKFQQKEKKYKKLLTLYIDFLLAGCLGLYRKWVLRYLGLQQSKYQKLVSSIILNQIFLVNQGYLSIITIKLIRRMKVSPKIQYQKLMGMSLKGMLSPKNFFIDQELQIQGHYFTSILQISLLGQMFTPIQIFKQLEKLKSSICKDVDNYYTLQHKKFIKKLETQNENQSKLSYSSQTADIKKYQINGDNIMGIIAFLLSKVSTKIDQIYNVLLFLKFVYGETIFYGMNSHSYMYSTIWGAIQYIQNMDKNQEQVPNKSSCQVKNKISQKQQQQIEKIKEKLKKTKTQKQESSIGTKSTSQTKENKLKKFLSRNNNLETKNQQNAQAKNKKQIEQKSDQIRQKCDEQVYQLINYNPINSKPPKMQRMNIDEIIAEQNNEGNKTMIKQSRSVKDDSNTVSSNNSSAHLYESNEIYNDMCEYALQSLLDQQQNLIQNTNDESPTNSNGNSNRGQEMQPPSIEMQSHDVEEHTKTNNLVNKQSFQTNNSSSYNKQSTELKLSGEPHKCVAKNNDERKLISERHLTSKLKEDTYNIKTQNKQNPNQNISNLTDQAVNDRNMIGVIVDCAKSDSSVNFRSEIEEQNQFINNQQKIQLDCFNDVPIKIKKGASNHT